MEKQFCEQCDSKGVRHKKDCPLYVSRTKEDKTGFSVYSENGDFVRTYSIEVVGENAEELAKGYAKKINGKVQ